MSLTAHLSTSGVSQGGRETLWSPISSLTPTLPTWLCVVWSASSRVLKTLHDGAYDLARQLGIDGYGEVARVADMAGTLGYVISALDEVLRRKWPPSNEPDEYAVIADAATKSLTPLQVLATVLSAPDWTRKVSVNTTVNHLPDRLKSLLAKGLASKLSALVMRWAGWDVPHLHEHVDEEIQSRLAKQAQVQQAARPIPPPPGRRPVRRAGSPNMGGQFIPQLGASSYEKELARRCLNLGNQN